jgi:hypothetical protein
MGQVGAYTTYRQVVADPRCQEVLREAAADAGAYREGAAKVGALKLDQSGVAGRFLKTGKTDTLLVEGSYGHVLLAVLAWLAARAFPLTDVADADGQCVIPASLVSFGGQVVVTMRADGQHVHVDAAAKITGQLYDWGQANRTLKKLFGAIDARTATYRERDL